MLLSNSVRKLQALFGLNSSTGDTLSNVIPSTDIGTNPFHSVYLKTELNDDCVFLLCSAIDYFD